MANKACVNRLRKELRTFTPPPYIRAAPLESNLQEWRYVLQGPPDSPYAGGLYQGKIRFPDDYPFRPPAIMMLTPNGRFETDRRLCLSMSDYHPELWVPAWSVATILNGVLSFFLEDEPTTGAVVTTEREKRRLRDASAAFNDGDPIYRGLFPELVGGALFEDATATPTPSSAPALPKKDGTTAAAAPPAAAAAAAAAATAPPPPADVSGTTATAPPPDDTTPTAPLEAATAAAASATAAAAAAPPDDLPEIDWLAVEDPEEAAEAAAAAAEAAGGAGGADGEGADTPGSKSNAARNKKKREKEKAKRLAAQEAAGAS